MTDPSETGDHLIGAEQDPVPVTELAHALEVAGRRCERAAGVLNRLHDHHRHRVGAGCVERVLEIVQQEGGELRLGLVRGAVVAVRVPDVDDLRNQRLERRP